MPIYRIAAPAHLYFDVKAPSEGEALAKAEAVVLAASNWESLDEFAADVHLDTEAFPSQVFFLDATIYTADGDLSVEDEREDDDEEEDCGCDDPECDDCHLDEET